jgi:hypothetical protein
MIIKNPKNIALNESDIKSIEEIERLSGLSDEKLAKCYITSAARPFDSFGFHKLGLAYDIACQTLSIMRELYDGLRAANWPGGIGIAGPGLPLHVHVDRRHVNGYPPAYFIEWKYGSKTVGYPTEQVDRQKWLQCYEEIKRLYG